PFDIGLGQPDAFVQTRLDGGSDVGAGRRNDVAAPRVVACMRHRAGLANVSKGRHCAEAADAGHLHAEAVADALAHRTKHGSEVLAVLVVLDCVMQLAPDRLDLFDRIARLLEDEGNVEAFAAEAKRVAGRQSSVAVDSETKLLADLLPDLPHDFYVDLHRAAADLYLHTGIPFRRALLGDAGDVVRLSNRRSVLRRHALRDRAAQKIGDARLVMLACQIVSSDVNRRFCVAMTVQ